MPQDPLFSRSERAVSALTVGYLTAAVTMALSFLITPFILSEIGRSAYGVWAILGQVVGYIGLTELGLSSGLMTFASRRMRREDDEDTNQLASTAGVLLLLLGALGFFVALALALGLRQFPDIEGVPSATVAGALIIVGLAYWVRQVGQTLDQVLVASQSLTSAYAIGFLGQLFRFVVILSLLGAGWGLVGLAVAAFAESLFRLWLLFVRVRKTVPALSLHPHHFRRRWVKPLMGFGAWSSLGRLSSTLIYNTDNIVIGAFLGPSAVTVYVLSRRLLEILRQNIYRIGNVIRPGVGDLFGSEQLAEVKATFLAALRVYMTLVASLGIVIVFLSERVVSLWVGAENYGGDALIWVTALSAFTLCLFHISSVFLVAELRVRPVGLLRFTEASINLVLSVFFLRLGWGLVGVALGTLTASVITSAWRAPYLASRVCNVAASEFTRLGILVPLISGGILWVSCESLNRVEALVQMTWLSTLGYLACVSPIVLAVVSVLGLSEQHRRSVLARIRSAGERSAGSLTQ